MDRSSPSPASGTKGAAACSGSLDSSASWGLPLRRLAARACEEDRPPLATWPTVPERLPQAQATAPDDSLSHTLRVVISVVHQSHQRRYHRPVIEALIPLLVGTLVLVFQLPFADRLLAEFTPSPRPRERLLVRAIVVVIALALIVLGVARLVSN